MTLKYMNLLKGASRSVAREWMNETRILLETQQAIDVLLAYAGAIGLAYLHATNPPKVSTLDYEIITTSSNRVKVVRSRARARSEPAARFRYSQENLLR